MDNCIKYIFILGIISSGIGCYNNNISDISTSPVDKNDERAIELVNELYEYPYESLDDPKTSDSFLSGLWQVCIGW